ncbi:iron-containing alcohol dehydrogenase, partial [Hansschlegelia beijingensis]
MTALEAVEHERVRVALGERSYDILIGPHLLDTAGERIAALGARTVAVVTDENVAALHLPVVVAALRAAGLKVETVTVSPGETSKSFETLGFVVDSLLAARIERGDVVLALGGGVIGDLA